MIVLLGLVAGFINGLFGTGAGMIVLPGLISLFSLDNKVARGTSLFILVIISSITSIFYVKNLNFLVPLNYTSFLSFWQGDFA